MVIQGGNLNKAEFTEMLAKKLSKNANKPYGKAFDNLAEIKVKQGAYNEYKESLKTKKTSKKVKVVKEVEE